MTLNKLPQEIRDECRRDRQISRQTLLNIARKKQARAMMTAYNNYKAKLQKGQTPRQKKDPNDAAAMLDSFGKLTEKIKVLDSSAWSVDDAALFKAALTEQKLVIYAYLTAHS